MVYAGSDTFSKQSVIQVSIWIAAFFFMSYYRAVIPAFKEVSGVYFDLIVASLVIMGLGFLIRGVTGDRDGVYNFNVFVHEKPMVDLKLGRWYGLLLAGGALMTFLVLSGTEYRLFAPSFQVAQATAVNSAFLSGFAGIIENMFFFAVLPSFLFFVTRLAIHLAGGGRQDKVALAIAVLLTPFIFLVYHNTVYGIDRFATSMFVLLFGFEVIGATLLLGSLNWADVRHFANNFAVTFFAQASLATLVVALLSTSFTYFVGAAGLGALAGAQWGKGRRQVAAFLAMVALILGIVAVAMLFS